VIPLKPQGKQVFLDSVFDVQSDGTYIVASWAIGSARGGDEWCLDAWSRRQGSPSTI